MRLSFLLLSFFVFKNSMIIAGNVEKEMKEILEVCGATHDYESKLKCMQRGIDGKTNGESSLKTFKGMCSQGTTWGSVASCLEQTAKLKCGKGAPALKRGCGCTTVDRYKAWCYEGALFHNGSWSCSFSDENAQ
jgi:hypothetical protein